MRSGNSISPHTPAFDLQQACGTGPGDHRRRRRDRRRRRYEVAAAGGGGHHLRRPDRPRRQPAAVAAGAAAVAEFAWRDVVAEVERRPAQAGRLPPAALGIEIPTNGEPLHRLVDGEHAAVTAKKMGHQARRPDALAAASHRNMAAAYDRGFFDDLGDTVPRAVPRQQSGADSSVEKLATPRRCSGSGRRRHHDGRQLHPAHRRRLGGAAVQRAVGSRPRPHPAGPISVDAETAAVDYVNGGDGLLMAPTYAVPRLLARKRFVVAGLRFRDPRGVRVRWWCCHLQAGVRGVLQGAPRARRGDGAIDRSKLNVNGSSPAAATRSPPRAGGSSHSWPNSWRRSEPRRSSRCGV